MIQVFGQQITLIEILGALFGIAGVWLTVKEKILCFPVGIVNVALYAWLFFQSHLYADAMLQIVYIVLLVYGWYEWSHGSGKKKELPVTKISSKVSVYLLLIVLSAT